MQNVDSVNIRVHDAHMANTAGAYHHGDLRAALLAEAADMIADDGVGSITMRAIGARLGVSRTALYRHFPDKNALLVAVAAVGFERLTERLRSVGAGGARPSLERFRRMGEEYIRFALENPAHYRLMYGKESLARMDQPELRLAANALFEHLERVIRVHQRSGTIKRQDPRVQAHAAWAAVHGLASLLIERQILAPVDVDRLICTTTQTLLDGLRLRRRSES